MSRGRIGFALALGLGAFASSASAQESGFSDPFFLYYGFFLPRQAALAAQPQPEDTIRALSAQRQAAIQVDRAGLYDPVGGIGLNDLDPLSPFGRRSGASRLVATVPTGVPYANIRGTGVAGYHNRTNNYFPSRGASAGGGPRGGLSARRPTSAVPTSANPNFQPSTPRPAVPNGRPGVPRPGGF